MPRASSLRSGYPQREILDDYPSLPADGIDAVVRRADQGARPNDPAAVICDLLLAGRIRADNMVSHHSPT